MKVTQGSVTNLIVTFGIMKTTVSKAYPKSICLDMQGYFISEIILVATQQDYTILHEMLFLQMIIGLMFCDKPPLQ